MPAPNFLEVQCTKCKISDHCPVQGSSPLLLRGGKTAMVCRIPGGYARNPPRPDSLSEESKALQEKNGSCLTMVEVPMLDVDSGKAYWKIVKIWHPEIRHAREKTNFQMDALYPRTHKK